MMADNLEDSEVGTPMRAQARIREGCGWMPLKGAAALTNRRWHGFSTGNLINICPGIL